MSRLLQFSDLMNQITNHGYLQEVDILQEIYQEHQYILFEESWYFKVFRHLVIVLAEPGGSLLLLPFLNDIYKNNRIISIYYLGKNNSNKLKGNKS